MPHTRSAKKNLRKSEKRRVANKARKRAVKTQVKRFQEALDGPLDALKKEFNLAVKKLDKAAAKRVIHPNLAARKKSQLARALHAKAAAPPPPAQA
jgi:small subunit ribosomal protein S20